MRRRKEREHAYNVFSFEEKKFILQKYFEEGLRRSEIRELFDIAESTFRLWLEKIKNNMENIEALRNKRHPNPKWKSSIIMEISDWEKAEIKRLLKISPGIGPLKIKQHFFRKHQKVLSQSKIYMHLKSEGIIEKRKKEPKKKKEKKGSFEYPEPMAAVQVDLLFLTLIGKKKIYLVTFLDDFSRFILLSVFVIEKTMDKVIQLLMKVIKKYGVMDRILCDCGSEFVSWQSFSRFEEILCSMDIELIASGPAKPENQGKLERWHQTYRKECEALKGGFNSMAHAQLETDRFVSYYNYERPHQGIGGLYPADRFHGMNEELEKELETYKSGDRKEECIYFCCNINGKKLVVSGSRKDEIKVYLDGEEINKEEEPY